MMWMWRPLYGYFLYFPLNTFNFLLVCVLGLISLDLCLRAFVIWHYLYIFKLWIKTLISRFRLCNLVSFVWVHWWYLLLHLHGGLTISARFVFWYFFPCGHLHCSLTSYPYKEKNNLGNCKPMVECKGQLCRYSI